MDLYQLTFGVLVVASIGLAWTQHRHELVNSSSSSIGGGDKEVDDEESAPALGGKLHEPHGDPARFRRVFLPVYLLVMGSDWLQGAYVYTLYKDEKGLAESVVAALFTSGFLAAALSALFVGSLADRHGRRLACLCFCVTYAVGCLTKISNDVIVLFIGRLLGGLSTTLMYSAFESWMVTEYYAQQLEKSDMSLSAMFGVMTTLNSIVAILSGVLGESLVAVTGTKVSPFMAAILCLGGAFWLMTRYWGENYGDSADMKKLDTPEKSTFRIVLDDKRILVLGFISCCFEGSMYIFVFFWSAAMKSAHALSSHVTDTPADAQAAANIPFGVIFATFMAAMMLGSLAFSQASSPSPSSLLPSSVHRFLTPATLLTIAIAGASSSLLLTVLCKSESVTFWCFCVFELCIGVYFPSMGAQKGRIIDDGVRANVYGVMRIPLNVFVVVALTTTVEGDAHRDRVFVFCGGLLLAASVAAGYWLADEVGDEEERVDVMVAAERVE